MREKTQYDVKCTDIVILRLYSRASSLCGLFLLDRFAGECLALAVRGLCIQYGYIRFRRRLEGMHIMYNIRAYE